MRLLLRWQVLGVAVVCAVLSPAARGQGGEEHLVRPGEGWSGLAGRVGPGDTIVLAAGEHRPASLSGLSGTESEPITIRGEAGSVIEAEGSGLYLQRPRWVVLEDVTVVGAAHNGINIDDQDGTGAIGEPWEAHLTLRRVTVRETGPEGNFDGIKLSGLRGVRLEECVVEGWGGSAVDMVGCHEVQIERCVFRGMEGYSQSSGVQIKGGSSGVRVTGCRFEEAGMRAINAGGSTGLEYFRPPVPEDAEPWSWWEARGVRVEGCVFVGGECAVAVVGASGVEISACTIVGPRRWAFRLLQETRDPRFGASEGALVARCVIVADSLKTPVNLGDGTDPATFRWGTNIWWSNGLRGEALARALPGEVKAEQIVQDPALDEQLRPTARGLGRYGAGR